MLALVWGRGPRAEPLSLDSGLATWVGMLFTRPGGHGGDGGSLQKISSMDETVNETWVHAYEGIGHNEEGNSDTCFCVGAARGHADE